MPSNARMNLIRLLAARMERLSVDSIWARRASGIRRALIKSIEAEEAGQELADEQLDLLIEHSFEMLRRAAMEIPDAESAWKNLRPR